MAPLHSFEYPATLLRKKDWSYSLLSFYAEAGDLKTFSGVYRKEVSQQGYQRILNNDHAQQIRKFLRNTENVIPNSVVIAFNDKLDIGGESDQGAVFEAATEYHPVNADGAADEATVIANGVLRVRVHPRTVEPASGDTDVTLSDFRSAYVIDGQHRIQGGNGAGSNVYLPVTAFLGVTREDQAFHFIVINRKARKVSKHDIDAVIPKRIYDNLQRRLVEAGIVSSDADIVYGLDNVDDSPFKGLIVWANNQSTEAIIPKGAIDNIIKQIRKVSDDDDLREISDNEIDLLATIWRGVERHLRPLWKTKQYTKGAMTYDNQLIQKAAGVFPAIQLMIVNALQHGGITVPDDADDKPAALEEAVFNYIRLIPLELFYCRWLKKSITNDATISELSQLLTKARKAKRVPYAERDGARWFAQPESVETAAEKRRLEREEKKKAKAGERKKGGARKKARTTRGKAAPVPA